MDGRGLAAPALLDGERKRPAHVLEAASPFALVRAGTTEVAERPRRLGQSELGGEPQSSLRGSDRVPKCGADEKRSRTVPRKAATSSRPGGSALEQGDRLGDRVLAARITQSPEHTVERRQRSCRGDGLALFPIERERLLQSGSRLLIVALLLRGPRPVLEQEGPLRMSGGSELERTGKLRLSACDVERERAFTGEDEVVDRLRLEFLRLDPPGRPLR